MSIDPPASVRARFAPSPTGWLHIGGLRTALYNYLFARQHNGTFIVRIEDTDQTRYVEDAEDDILRMLDWAGLDFDEGPVKGGPHASYYQSERRERYEREAARLLEAGHAYLAFDTQEEIDEMRKKLSKSGNPSPKYDSVTRMSMRNSITMPQEEVARLTAAGTPHVVRLKVPRRETVRFEDMIRGWVSFETSGLDDQVLLKSDGMPTYHLANVVDDHEMEITHVIRGEEWLSSTPKHILLYQYLGWTPPAMAHLPLILSPTGGKLSKRNVEKLGIPVSVRDYVEAGYESEAVVNFIAFLGWNPGTEQELFTLDELVQAFSLERVGSGGVQLNLDKLRWYNQQFIRKMTPSEIAAEARPHLEGAGLRPDEDYLHRVVELVHDRISFVSEIASFFGYFFRAPIEYEEKGVKKRWKDDSSQLLSDYALRLEKAAHFDAVVAEELLREVAEEKDVAAGRIIHPTRLAVSGMSFGPSLFDMMALIGKDACVRRLKAAVLYLP